jgi:putative DNA primase/helicase
MTARRKSIADLARPDTFRGAGGSGNPDHLTDLGAAERFAFKHGRELRYDHRRGMWLRWASHRFQPDADQAIVRIAGTFARDLQREALFIPELERRDRVVRWAIGLERRSALDNTLVLARAMAPIADSGERWDRDPWLFGALNGVVPLKTGELRDGRPDDRVTMSAAVEYHADAKCPRWEQAIGEIFDGDSELIGFIQRAVGYSLTGITTEQILFICYGTGANGKGTFLNTLARLLGDYAFNMPFATVEMHQRAAIPNDLAALVSRRLVIASETNDGARLNEARVKALTGCDPITARFLHSEFFTFEPVAKFWLAVNHNPTVRDDSHGFWRRVRLVPFTRTFAVNPNLGRELEAEREGILAWAVRGCLAWQQQGLLVPLAVAGATSEYQADSDPLYGFLEESCEQRPDAQARASELASAYRAWADRQGLGDRERLNATLFGRRMAERFQRAKVRAGLVYRGIGIRDEMTGRLAGLSPSAPPPGVGSAQG